MNLKPERNKLRRRLQKAKTLDVSTASSRATTPDVRGLPPNLDQQPATPLLLQPTKYEPVQVRTTPYEVNNPSREQHVHRDRAASESRASVMARPHPLASLRRPDNLVKIAGVGSSSSGSSSSRGSWRSETPSSFVVPELAHLSPNASKRASVTLRPGEATRIHAHKQSHSTSSVPDPPARNPTRERRYAKTPIRSIEQHEFDDMPARDPRSLTKMTSTDLIAESYRMLIEADRSLLCTPKPSMHFLPLRQTARSPGGDVLQTTVVTSPGSETEDDSYDDPTTPRADHFAAGFGGDSRRSPRQADSPLSDAGTLVGPDELAAAIYFKPSFSPGLAPVLDDFVQHEEPAPSPTLSIDRNPGLSICLDLLSQELLSASAGTPMRPGSETSALQVQAMIEAYENLRDQALHMGLEADQALATRDMFDTWIQALRSVQAMVNVRDLPAQPALRRRPQLAAAVMA